MPSVPRDRAQTIVLATILATNGAAMIQTSYIGTASKPMSNETLLGLLKECRENNAGNGITGMLRYGNGTFLRVLALGIVSVLMDPRTSWGHGHRQP